jgi:hypothetical protein
VQEKGVETMDLVKEFVVIAGYMVGVIAVALLLLVGMFRALGKIRDKRKPDAQYTHQDATRELDAWETGDKFETRGGIDEQKAWDEDPLDVEDEVEDDTTDDDLVFDEENKSTEPVAELDNSQESSAVEETVVEEVEVQAEAVPEQSPEPTPEQPPEEAPPLPSGGLPEGWTMEQWRWYGHQWLERHGQN